MKKFIPIVALGLFASASCSAFECDPVFGDHMVLQRKLPVVISGSADASQLIEVMWQGRSWNAKADSHGRWRVTLPAMKTSRTGQDLIVRSGEKKIIMHDVVVGDVWLFSGQSNMDFPLAKAVGGREELDRFTTIPEIRLLHHQGVSTNDQSYDAATLQRLQASKFFAGSWQIATRDALASCSAIAWWTIISLHHNEPEVPLALIENSIGGSGTEAWIPETILKSDQAYRALLPDWLDSPRISPWARSRALKNLGEHRQSHHPFQPGFLFSSMQHSLCSIPLRGVVWYQGETNAEMPDKDGNAKLMIDLVRGWREHWQQPQLPFFLIELPRIGGTDPLRAHWPMYRQSQAMVAESMSEVHLIRTTDLGYNSADVHPPDKKPIAQRVSEQILRLP
jgi:sialate O-acetylesterase